MVTLFHFKAHTPPGMQRMQLHMEIIKGKKEKLLEFFSAKKGDIILLPY